MEQHEADLAMAQVLPEDVLADVLGRLPPRSLAACRCACRTWRAVVDSRDMLRADLLLPRALGGIFYNLNDHALSSWFLAHPSVRDVIPGFLDYTDEDDDEVHGHCNGLLLLEDSVANPATQQWASLPRRPPLYMGKKHYATCGNHLVYDPAVSPHYEVVSIPYDNPYISKDERDRLATLEKSVEWPASPLILLVFSSRTGQWEETPFLREGDPTWAAVAGMPLEFLVHQCYSVYWQKDLYVYWKADSIMRISMSARKYRLIQLPTDEKTYHLYLGKSEKGVYCAHFMDFSRLQIWFLSVSFDQTEWVLKYDNYLKPTLPQFDYFDKFYHEQPNGPWTLQDEYYYEDYSTMVVAEDQFDEWDSDSDDILQVDDTARRRPRYRILGFHPNKEVIFLEEPCGRAIAFHWNSSKFQHLGKLYPKDYAEQTTHPAITAGFPYTPCWIDLLKGNNY